MISARVLPTAVLGVALFAQAAEAQTRTNAQRNQERQMASVPRCDAPLGTITFAESETHDFDDLNLQPPQALLRVVVQRSGCFTIVERSSTAQNAIDRERRLAMSGALQRDSNFGGGQVRVADFIMLAEVTSASDDAAGSNVGGTLRGVGRGIGRGFLSGATGGMSDLVIRPQPPRQNERQGATVSGGLNSSTSEVNTVISIVNLRTTETLVASEGYAAKRDINWKLSASASFGGFVGGGYENTEVGRIVGQSLVNGYAKAVEDMQKLDLSAIMPAAAPEAEPMSQPTPAPTLVAQIEDDYEAPRPLRRTAATAHRAAPVEAEVLRNAILRDAPGGRVIVQLTAGTTVYPTGETEDGWREIEDEDGNTGWVQEGRLVDLS